MHEQSYKRIMDCSFFGYAYHRVLLDGAGKPVDYEFLEVNAGFEKMTGLRADNILGRRVTEALPSIKDDSFDWIGFYGRIALERTEEEFDQYSEPLKRWYKVNAYSPEALHFVTIIQDITTEKEHTLQMDRFFSVNLDLLCIADTSGNFVKVNAEWETVLGYTAQELEQRTFLEFVHPDDLQPTLAVMAELDEQKPVLQFVNRYRCKDGSYRHIEWRSHPHGSLIYAAARDITERKRAEEELFQSETRFKAIFAESPVSIIIHDKDTGAIVDANESAYTAYGLDSLEALQTHDFWMDPPYSADEALSWIRKAATQGTQRFEWMNRKISGEVFWEQVCLRAVTINNIERVLATTIDITERKRAEDALLESQARLDMFFSQSMSGFFFMMLDEPVSWNKATEGEKAALLDYVMSHLRMTKVNQAMLDQYGAREEDFIGITPNDLFAHDLEHGRHIWKGLFDQGRWHVETREQRLDGTPIIIDGDYICLYDEQGRITGHFGVQTDITKRRRAEKKLNDYAQQMEQNNIELDEALSRAEQASQAKGEFLANMSHEIRTPINAVVGLSDLLMSTDLNPKQRNYLSKINNSSRMLLGIINDILDFSKIEAGRLELDLHAFRLDELLDQLKTLFAATADEKGLELLFRVAPDVPRALRGDSLRLGQVLTNLLSNALKFTEQGQVVVGIEKTVGPSDSQTVGASDRQTVGPSDRRTVRPSDRPTIPPSHRPTIPPSHRPTVPPSCSVSRYRTRASAWIRSRRPGCSSLFPRRTVPPPVGTAAPGWGWSSAGGWWSAWTGNCP